MSNLNGQLFAAIEKGNIDEIATLLKNGTGVNAKDSQGRTVLIKATALSKIHMAIRIAGKWDLEPNIERATKYIKALSSPLYVISLKEKLYMIFNKQNTD